MPKGLSMEESNWKIRKHWRTILQWVMDRQSSWSFDFRWCKPPHEESIPVFQEAVSLACMITYMESEPDFPVLKMPCGHSILSDGLMNYCWSEIGLGKYEIRCCLCKTEWLMEVIRKYGGATKAELEQLEVGLSNNYCNKNEKIQQCPGCKSLCERQDSSKACT